MEQIITEPVDVKDLRQAELERVRKMAKIEFSWWEKGLIRHAAEGLAAGTLVECPDVGEGYRLISRLRNKTEPNLLRRQTLDLLKLVASRWRVDMSEKDSFLSVTSLYRSADVQANLIKEGANAALVSTHQAGASIDFDPTAYYFGQDFKPVNAKTANFNPDHSEVLFHALERLQNSGLCNFIPERSYKSNENGQLVEYDSCYHVCVSPNLYTSM